MNHNLFKTVMEQLPTEDIQALLNPAPLLCIAIKTQDQGYVYANQNFYNLMGFSTLKEIIHLKDKDLYSNQTLLNLYREHDDIVYNQEKPLWVQGDVAPDRRHKLVKSMEGMLHPLHLNGSKPDAVLLMHKPSNEILTLSLTILLSFSADQLAGCLTKNSYPVRYKDLPINLARMEILCFSELLKGKSASKIAESLGLKSLTVESYLTNLRDKCGVGTKRELVQFFIDSNILESIVV